MGEGTIVYTDVPEIKTPPNCIKINATECFSGNILAPAEHAENWFRSRRGSTGELSQKFTEPRINGPTAVFGIVGKII